MDTERTCTPIEENSTILAIRLQYTRLVHLGNGTFRQPGDRRVSELANFATRR